MNKKTKIYGGDISFYVEFEKPDVSSEYCKKISSETTKGVWVYVIEHKNKRKLYNLGWSWEKPPSNHKYVAYAYFWESETPREIWAYYQ